ncbi:MAG: SMP-30/gluconolactonase/LRE family protein, partial [Clostridia bacterium]
MKRKIDLIFRGLELGEGCIWDSKRNMVHFLDIHGFKIYSSILYASTLNNDSISCINTKNYVSAIVLDENNDLIACVKDKIFKYNLETGTRDLICKIPLPENFRFNDGKCDQYGNLWIGTM